MIVEILATTTPPPRLTADDGRPVLMADELAVRAGVVERIGGWILDVLIRNLGRGPGAHRGSLDPWQAL